MDTSVDPCADFFAYSCGGWIKKNPIPPDQSSWSVYSKLEDDNKAILREILERATTPATDRDAVKQKIGDYYTACMDEKAINLAAISRCSRCWIRFSNCTPGAQSRTSRTSWFTTTPCSDFAPIRTIRTLRKSSPKWTRVGLGCRTRDETKRLRATIDLHSPDKYRANGVVSNLPEFQEAFHCKAGSPMVRENRCRV
jgi:predicted metalloendopeptidase